MATKGSEVRKLRENGVELLFPSGNTYAIRPIDIGAFIKFGSIPEILKPVVIDAINMGESTVQEAKNYEESVEWIGFLDKLAEFALVHPRVVPGESKLEEDDVYIEDIDLNDKLYIFKFFARPANELSRFLEFQKAAVAIMDAPKGDGSSGIETPKDKDLGEPVYTMDAGRLDSVSG